MELTLRKHVMKRAHYIYQRFLRVGLVSFADCLRMAWRQVKALRSVPNVIFVG